MVRIVKKTSERRSEIVKAARHLFQTKEYDKATMQDIMVSLGIAKGTIYHYFKSKEALLEAVIENIVEENLAKMQKVIQGVKGDALHKFQLLVRAGNIAEDQSNILDHLHRRGNDLLHVRILAATLVKQAPFYAELIAQGCREKLFQTDTPLECAEFILAAVQFLTDVGIYHWSPEDLARRVQAFPKLIEQQLKAPPGSFKFLVKML